VGIFVEERRVIFPASNRNNEFLLNSGCFLLREEGEGEGRGEGEEEREEREERVERGE